MSEWDSVDNFWQSVELKEHPPVESGVRNVLLTGASLQSPIPLSYLLWQQLQLAASAMPLHAYRFALPLSRHLLWQLEV